MELSPQPSLGSLHGCCSMTSLALGPVCAVSFMDHSLGKSSPTPTGHTCPGPVPAVDAVSEGAQFLDTSAPPARVWALIQQMERKEAGGRVRPGRALGMWKGLGSEVLQPLREAEWTTPAGRTG